MTTINNQVRTITPTGDESFVAIELEWWATTSRWARSGREILCDAMCAAKNFVVAETVTVAQPAMLEFVPDECEASLDFSVVIRHRDDLHEFADAIRDSGIRVKYARVLPDGLDGTDFAAIDAYDEAEYQQIQADLAAEV